MNDKQKQELVKRMRTLDGMGFSEHATWATQKFGMVVTTEQCRKLMFDSMFEVREDQA